jgi:cation:H+ antiporter
MTGSNRLPIGVGWPLVAVAAFAAYRRNRRDQIRAGDGSVTAGVTEMEPSRRVEVGFLAAASSEIRRAGASRRVRPGSVWTEGVTQG